MVDCQSIDTKLILGKKWELSKEFDFIFLLDAITVASIESIKEPTQLKRLLFCSNANDALKEICRGYCIRTTSSN